MIAQIDLRHDLGAVRIADVGVSHGTKEDRVGGAGGAKHFLRQGDAGLQVELRARFVRLEAQPDVARLATDGSRSSGTAPSLRGRCRHQEGPQSETHASLPTTPS